MIEYIMLLAGVGLLLAAGDVLVRGAVSIADHLNIPPLIIGLTIVAFGTSAPELIVCIQAVLDGAPDIALGNVVGSNIANILLVLGTPALIAPTVTDQPGAIRNTLYMIGVTFVFIAMCFMGPLSYIHATFLLLLMLLWLWDSARRAQNGDDIEDLEEFEGPAKALPVAILFVVLGIVGLPIAADIIIDSARVIALRWGVSEAAIGLTVVALGTSLPELAATVMAAIRRESAIAIGNVLGSNVFNLLAIMGITTMVGEVPVQPQFLSTDLWVMAACALLILPFVMRRLEIGRGIGIAFVGGYVAYCIYVLGHGMA
ncbi:MAG: calcium/sodium antiporter [Pseudomonadota bacterium]